MAVYNLPDDNLIYNLQEGIAINFCINYVTDTMQIFWYDTRETANHEKN